MEIVNPSPAPANEKIKKVNHQLRLAKRLQIVIRPLVKLLQAGF